MIRGRLQIIFKVSLVLQITVLFHFVPLHYFVFILFLELPQLQVEADMDLKHYPPPPCVSYEGYLFKTASMGRAVAERKVKEGMCKKSVNQKVY